MSGPRGSVLFFDPKLLADQLSESSSKSTKSRQSLSSFAEGDEEDDASSIPKSSSGRASAKPTKKGSEKEPIAKRRSQDQGKRDFIKVAIRIRPMLPKDKGQDDVVKLHLDGQSVSVEHPAVKPRIFGFDFIFDSRSSKKHQLGYASQDDVFQALGTGVVESALNGYNSCLFAYGQTGTGKTHTVLGHSDTREERGLLPRILENMFNDMDTKKRDKVHYGEAEFQVKISYLEIYNESIHDLLVPPKLAKDRALQVKYHPKLGVVVNDLTESVANTIEEASELVAFGTKMRSVAATSMNSRSSRAHTLFTFRFEQNMPNGDSVISQVQLVDLAGREQERTSGDDPERLRERSFINKSLFHLSTCISNLCKSKSKDKLPEWAFRNSKLTLLLSHSLGGNSRTAMVAAVSPSAADAEETQSTLRFAGAVKSIKTTVSCNQMNKKDLVKQMTEEIERLRMEVHRKSSEGKDDQIAQLEALVEHYREGYQKEKSASKDMAVERRRALEELGLSTDHGELVGVSAQSNIPYLVNLSEDPYLDGCLMYFIRQCSEATLGSAEDNTIVLGGLGIREHHCCFTNVDDKTLRIRPLDWTADDTADPRVYLNGGKVVSEAEMFHKDRLVLGMAHAFRVVIPKAAQVEQRERVGSEGVSVDELMPTVTVFDATQKRWIQDVINRYGETKAEVFAKELQEGLQLINEANEITGEVPLHEGLQFQLDVLSDTLSTQSKVPTLVACLMQVVPEKSAIGRRNSSIGRKQEKSLKFVWDMQKFKCRLDSMRDIYEEMAETSEDQVRDRLEQEPYNDPWKEIGAAEVGLLIEGLSTGLLPSQFPRASNWTAADSRSTSVSTTSGVDEDVGDDVSSMFALGQRKSLAMTEGSSMLKSLEDLRKNHEESGSATVSSSSEDSDEDDSSTSVEVTREIGRSTSDSPEKRTVSWDLKSASQKKGASTKTQVADLQKENQELRESLSRLRANPQELETLRSQVRQYEMCEAQRLASMEKMQGWELQLRKKETQLQQIEGIASRLRTLEKQHLTQKVEAFRHMLAKKANGQEFVSA